MGDWKVRVLAAIWLDSEDLNFEAAARYRDQINVLRKVQERQWVSGTQDEMDVFGFSVRGNMACIQVMFIRDSQLLGSKAYFPKVPSTATEDEIFESFFLQFYLSGFMSPSPVEKIHHHKNRN